MLKRVNYAYLSLWGCLGFYTSRRLTSLPWSRSPFLIGVPLSVFYGIFSLWGSFDYYLAWEASKLVPGPSASIYLPHFCYVVSLGAVNHGVSRLYDRQLFMPSVTPKGNVLKRRFYVRVVRLFFYPHQLPPTLHVRRPRPSAFGVRMRRWLEKKPNMNDSSIFELLNARSHGTQPLASFLGTGVASSSVRFLSCINTTPFASFHHFNLADFSRENPSPLLPIWSVSCHQYRHFQGRSIHSRSASPVSSSFLLFAFSFFFIFAWKNKVSLGT